MVVRTQNVQTATMHHGVRPLLRRLSPMRIVCVLALFLFVGCSDPVTLENFNRIQTGMTVDEVSKIMDGRKPESYQTFKTWRGSNSRTISVEIDDRGMVVNKTRDGFK